MTLQLICLSNHKNVPGVSRFHALASGWLSLLLLATFCAAGALNAQADSLPGPVSTPSLPAGTVGTAYLATITPSRGIPPYQFAVAEGALPAGLALGSQTGAITGTPTKVGTSSFTLKITSSTGVVTRLSAKITISSSSGSSIIVTISPTSASLASGNTQQFVAMVQGTSNTAVTWSATAGVVSSSGSFTAPSVTSATNVTVTARSAADTTKTASAIVSVTPGAPSLSIATSSIPAAQSGIPYSYQISASGGTTPYQWTIASGSLPQGFTLNSSGILSGKSTQTGQVVFSVQVTDAGNSTALKTFALSVIAPQPPPTGGNYDGPAELPRTYLQTTMANTPAPGSTTPVSAGGNLQTAINSANCGDTLQLAAGATFVGNFTLPAKPCDDQHWIIIRTSAPDSSLPPEGSRINPCYAGVSSLPGRPAFTCPSSTNVLAKVVAQGNNPSGPFSLTPGANHYRFVGLEITRPAGTGVNSGLIRLPTGQADHIIEDRVWLHGTAQDETSEAIGLSGVTYAALIDSYTSDFHCTAVSGTCTDAKVIGGGTSAFPGGPYKITNNFLEASGENILLGGGYALFTPADIEVRHNHFYKPLIWMKGQPGFVGAADGNAFMVKNLMELKNAQRVLVEGNIFEYSWGGFGQVGFAFLLTPKNQASGTLNICPVCEVTDVTFRYNLVSHVGTGISLANVGSNNGGFAKDGGRYSFHDIVVDDVNKALFTGGGTLFQVLNTWPTNALHDILISHVTGFPDPKSKIISLGNTGTAPMLGFTFVDSIVGQETYPVWSTGGTTNCAISSVPITSLNACFPGGYKFTNNAAIGIGGSYPLAKWPAGNFFPATAAAVGFMNFNNGNGGDYHLLSTSPYKNAGTDGKDLGADIDAVLAATANVN